jgi:hypothetical protein
MPKTWKEKLEEKKEPKLATLNKAMSGVPAGEGIAQTLTVPIKITCYP